VETAEIGMEYRDEDWPHGLQCPECRHVLQAGDRYTTQLYAFSEDVPMCLVVCVPCAT
jgi:hypothetical protein